MKQQRDSQPVRCTVQNTGNQDAQRISWIWWQIRWKNEERLRNLQDIFKCSNIQTIGIPEGEEEEQKMENLFEQIMKENVPYLAKEIDF